MSAQEVQKQFLTEKFRKLFYPVRPFLTALQVVALVGGGYIGLIPLNWAIWLGVMTGLDDVIMVPFTRFNQALDNLSNQRKQKKAIATLVAVTLGLLGGVFLSHWLMNVPAAMMMTQSILESFGNSLLFSFGLIMGASTLSKLTNEFIPSWLAMLGAGYLSSYIHVGLPLVAEIAFMSLCASTFLSVMISKKVMQGYYYLYHGHSNADGYDFNHTIDGHSSVKDNEIALNLSNNGLIISPEQVRALREVCLKGVEGVRARCHIGHDMTGSRYQLSGSFKNIYHLLNRAKTPEDVQLLKNLIETSYSVSVIEPAKLEDTSGPLPIKQLFKNLNEMDDTVLAQDPTSVGDSNHMSIIFEGTQFNEYWHLKLPHNAAKLSTDKELRMQYHKEGISCAFFKLNSEDDQYKSLQAKFKAAAAPFCPSGVSNLYAETRRHAAPLMC